MEGSDMGNINRINRIKQLEDKIADSKRTYLEIKSTCDAEIAEITQAITLSASGIDLDKVSQAKELIRVSGGASKSNLRKDMVTHAIRDLAAGCQHLKKEYYGIKVYSGFGEQSSSHEYGYGPKHGSIVFRIELLAPRDAELLSDDQKEAAIYYLLNIEKVQEAEKLTTGGE